MARPTDYTDDKAHEICEKIADGASLRKICQNEAMPNRSTVFRWLDSNASFATKYAHARELQGDWCDDEIAEVIESTKIGDLKPDVARVVLEGQKWRAAKLRPKKYGDFSRNEVSGPDGKTLQIQITPSQADIV